MALFVCLNVKCCIISKVEFCRGSCFVFVSAFLSTPGVDGQLVNEQWISNHYRWLVWKLAAMEVAFPRQFAGRQVYFYKKINLRVIVRIGPNSLSTVPEIRLGRGSFCDVTHDHSFHS